MVGYSNGQGANIYSSEHKEELNLESGDRLFIIKRKDGAGFVFIKLAMIDKLMDKIRIF